MSDFPTTARVVIIGGGAVGVSALYHLALRKLSDCVLLERNELTAGSTWHAAGNVPTFSASWSVMNMQRYSTELYRGLGEVVDYPMNYHVTGSLRLAHSRERMLEFERVVAMGRYQGMNIQICSVSDLKDRYPFIKTHDLEGALYDPNDGDIDPAQLTQALAKGARDRGAQIIRFCTVTGARRENGEWLINTDHGTIRCQYVVNAAGYRAQQVGAMFGRAVPMATMSHQYLTTEECPELKAWSEETGHKLPLLRDVDSSYYLRQEKYGFNLGPYEKNCRAHWISPDDPMPDDFSFQLYPDDLDRIEWYIEDAMARVPLMSSVGVNRVINGPIPYTPDGNPLIGPMPGVVDAFEACVFTFGIAQAGGAGKVLAEWIVDEATEWDMWSCDPRRFGNWVTQSYVNAKSMEVYGHEYAMHFAHHEWPAGRNQRCSTLHETLLSRGAQMGVYGGWERANWFAKPGDDISEEATLTWRADGPWESRVRDECLAVRDASGVLDLPGFARFEVSGKGAVGWLQNQITGTIPRVGCIGLVYFADQRGRIVTEMSMTRIASDHFWLISAAAAELHEFELLNSHLTSSTIQIRNLSEDLGTLILAGPKTREFLSRITNADLQVPWLSHQSTAVAGKEVRLVRVSYTGELGFEIHTAVENIPPIYDALCEVGNPKGLQPFGMYALDSLRIEKGYRTWKGDLSTDYSMLEAGLERFIHFSKGNFPGRLALLKEHQAGSKKRFAVLEIEAGEWIPPYMATVLHNDVIVGEITSANRGYRCNKTIGFAMLPPSLTVTDTQLEVESYGRRLSATVQPTQVLWDEGNKAIKIIITPTGCNHEEPLMPDIQKDAATTGKVLPSHTKSGDHWRRRGWLFHSLSSGKIRLEGRRATRT